MDIVNKIRELLGMEIKLEQAKLMDGTALEFEKLESGVNIFIVNGEDRIPLPIGEYELEDGRLLVITEDGIIAEIKETAQEPEVPVNENMAGEFVTKAEFDELKKLVESLKQPEKMEAIEVKEVEVVESVDLSAEPKPFVHNPDSVTTTSIHIGNESLVEFLNKKVK
jgi:hypothetical protein